MKPSAIHITPQEADALGKYTPVLIDTIDFLGELLKLRADAGISLSDWKTVVFICDVFNAGRISGVREERLRRNK